MIPSATKSSSSGAYDSNDRTSLTEGTDYDINQDELTNISGNNYTPSSTRRKSVITSSREGISGSSTGVGDAPKISK